MGYTELLTRLGFTADPFAKTNADEEELLKSYFIEPPFFKAVYGDLATPKSAVVFAPRGGGKTALKRMLELSSLSDPFLCVSYNQFSVAGLRLDQIDSEYHLKNIIRLLLVAHLSAVVDRGIGTLSDDDRHLIYLLSKEYLSDIDTTELKFAIQSVQSLSDRAKEWWNKFTGPVGFVLNALLTRVGLGKAELDKFSTAGGRLGRSIEQIEILGRLTRKLGYKCVYILVDKIDENPLTGKASSSFKFIAPLVSDLQVLEMVGFGFKFFLWDMLISDYREVARADRVKYYVLRWEVEQIREMLSKRLLAYSDNRVRSLGKISADDFREHIDLAVAQFSQGSPRTAIRLCKEILDQQSEIDSAAAELSAEAIVRGFDVFARNYVSETLDEGIIRDLQKMKRADFTVKYVYTDIFKFTQQAGMTKVRSWQDAGVVEQIGEIQETRGARSSNHYGVNNLMILKHMFPELTVLELISRKMEICTCGQILVRDWDRSAVQTCHNCQKSVERKVG